MIPASFTFCATTWGKNDVTVSNWKKKKEKKKGGKTDSDRITRKNNSDRN